MVPCMQGAFGDDRRRLRGGGGCRPLFALAQACPGSAGTGRVLAQALGLLLEMGWLGHEYLHLIQAVRATILPILPPAYPAYHKGEPVSLEELLVSSATGASPSPTRRHPSEEVIHFTISS
jgi:hypothetical protein